MSAAETRRGKVQTVLGLVEPEAIGPTLMHEHLLSDVTPPRLRATDADDNPEITLCNCWKINYAQVPSRRKLVLDDLEIAVAEVAEMREAGGGAIVELTCGGLSPRPKGLAEISRRTGVPIVMGCGYYVDEFQPEENLTRSVENFAREIVEQVTVGAWGTGIRAGIIGEIGCQHPWTDREKRVMAGALLAQAETGASVNVHPGRDVGQPLEIMAFVEAHGGRADRVIISHIDRTLFEPDDVLRLADTGCVLEWDLFGIEQSYYRLADIDMPNDAMRLKLIRSLLDRGYRDQVVISHDICHRTRLTRYGGHGYQHVFSNVVPLMRRRNFSDAEVEAIMVGTPRRLLTFV